MPTRVNTEEHVYLSCMAKCVLHII